MNGPHSSESGAQFSGLNDFAKPSGRLMVTGTQIASSSPPRGMTLYAYACSTRCAVTPVDHCAAARGGLCCRRKR